MGKTAIVAVSILLLMTMSIYMFITRSANGSEINKRTDQSFRTYIQTGTYEDKTLITETVDIAVTEMTNLNNLQIGLPIPYNSIRPIPGPINVDVARWDSNYNVPTAELLVSLFAEDASNPARKYKVGEMAESLAVGESRSVQFSVLEQDPLNPLVPNNYRFFSNVTITTASVDDVNLPNNVLYEDTLVPAGALEGDINVDGGVEITDFFLGAEAFGSYPDHPRWDVRCDMNLDFYIDLWDFFTLSRHYGEQYP